MTTKPPFSFTDIRLWSARVLNASMVDRNVFLALNLERPIIAGNIDGIPTSPRCFSTNRTVTAHKRIRMMALDAEANRSAMARTF
jgi:hypothetical protein